MTNDCAKQRYSTQKKKEKWYYKNGASPSEQRGIDAAPSMPVFHIAIADDSSLAMVLPLWATMSLMGGGLEKDPPSILALDALLALLSFALAAASAVEGAALMVVSCLELAKSFHLRQPSKSMRACMQPHSLTLRSSHTKFTGWNMCQ